MKRTIFWAHFENLIFVQKIVLWVYLLNCQYFGAKRRYFEITLKKLIFTQIFVLLLYLINYKYFGPKIVLWFSLINYPYFWQKDDIIRTFRKNCFYLYIVLRHYVLNYRNLGKKERYFEITLKKLIFVQNFVLLLHLINYKYIGPKIVLWLYLINYKYF